MGLDMFLTGDKYFWNVEQNNQNRSFEDGFRIKGKQLELGYWRKHPNLHGFIVKTFAEGKDECQEISLHEEEITAILDAVIADTLPIAEGFSFGKSDGSEREETIAIFKKALEWLKTPEPHVLRSVIYRASW